MLFTLFIAFIPLFILSVIHILNIILLFFGDGGKKGVRNYLEYEVDENWIITHY